MLSRHCNNKEDIHEYGKTWIIDITKVEEDCEDCQTSAIKFDDISLVVKKRTPEQIQACYNNCNQLAVAGSFICACLPVPPQLGGPITAAACKLWCLAFVEVLREDCETCCRNTDNKCWNSFHSWKSD